MTRISSNAVHKEYKTPPGGRLSGAELPTKPLMTSHVQHDISNNYTFSHGLKSLFAHAFELGQIVPASQLHGSLRCQL